MNNKFISISQLMVLLGMSRQTVYLLLKRGLPSYKVGKRRVFDEGEVIEWVKGKRNGKPTEKGGKEKLTLAQYEKWEKEAFQEAEKMRPDWVKANRVISAYLSGKGNDPRKAKAASTVMKKYVSLKEKEVRILKKKLRGAGGTKGNC